MIVGSLALNAKINIVFMIIGIIIGAVAAYICKIVFLVLIIRELNLCSMKMMNTIIM